jgi:hypothetical protein
VPLVPVQLPPGLVRAATPYETPGRWWDMNQSRWRAGVAMPIGGWQKLGTPLDSAVRKIDVWRDNTAQRKVLVGTDAKLYADDSGDYVDVTPEDLVGPGSVSGAAGGYGTFEYGDDDYGTARSLPSPIYSPYGYWSMDNWGEDTILTANSDGRLFYYTASTPTVAPAVISTAPTGNSGVLVTAERHVITIGSDADPRKVAWCSREDYEDWDFESTTNSAGFLNLKTRTPLLMGWNVSEGVLVSSYTDVFLLRYLGQPFVYGGTDPISDTSLFNPASVVPVAGQAFWPTRRGFQMYSGGAVQMIDCPILADILEDMDPIWGPFRIHGAHNGIFPEIWWFYPSQGETECDRYVIYNYQEGWWGWGALSRSAMAPAGAYQRPYMGNASGQMYEHEFGWLDNGASRVGQVWLETGALSVSGGERTMDVNQMQIATGKGYDRVTATVFGVYTPEGEEYEDGPFTPRSDGYTDARFSYRDARLRFVNASDEPFSVGTVKLDISGTGTGR